jgi:ribosomal protein S1
MEPGVEALAPAREFPPTSSDWRDGVSPGTRRDWRVLAVDRRKRRMSLVPVIEGAPVEPVPLEAGAVVPGRVQRIERFGVFVWLGPGQVGLLPVPLSGIPQGTRLDSRFRAGDEIRVQVVDVTEDGKRIRLAAEGVDPESIAQDRDRGGPRPARDAGASARAATSSSPPDQPFVIVLGDALRNALGRSGSNERPGDSSGD